VSADLQARLEAWQQRQSQSLSNFAPVTMRGRIQRVNGMLLQCRLPQARIGDLCQVEKSPGDYMLAEIIGFDQQDAVLSALGNLEGVRVGAGVERLGVSHRVQVSEALLGQVLDGFGRPITGQGVSALSRLTYRIPSAVLCEAPLPTERPRINRALATGVRSIDGLMTIGEGQRVGLFAGAGCGKTTLLAEIARNVECDVIVFGLIGERGRSCVSFSTMSSMTSCAPRRYWCAPPPIAPAWSAPEPRSRPRHWPKVFGARGSGYCC